MANGNNKFVFGTTYTYGVVVRGNLDQINLLIDFLKSSDLVIAFNELGTEKLYIKKGDKLWHYYILYITTTTTTI